VGILQKIWRGGRELTREGKKNEEMRRGSAGALIGKDWRMGAQKKNSGETASARKKRRGEHVHNRKK